MRRARWLVISNNRSLKPVLFHCISRVVDRRFVFAERECKAFRMFMRMYENFSGCRVLSYCVMSNHFHLLLEVPPMPVGGLADEELLKRLSALYSEAFVAGVAKELVEAREGSSKLGVAEDDSLGEARVAEIHARTGTLWEERFKSVTVESCVAARTMAAYIDLNPVRAGMVTDPANYRWSSYGEAVGGGAKGNGKKAREGLVRVYFCEQGVGFGVGKKPGLTPVPQVAKGLGQTTKNTAELLASEDNETVLKNLRMAKLLRCRIRYFTDGAMIGSKEFVNEAFAGARERFGSKRKDGARKMRGAGAGTNGILWSLRDLQKGHA